MLFMRIAAAVMGLTIILTPPAHAGADLGEARAWGLIGKWTNDCRTGIGFLIFEESDGGVVAHTLNVTRNYSNRRKMRNVKALGNELSYETDVERTTWKKTNDSQGRIVIFQSVMKANEMVVVKNGRNVHTGAQEVPWVKCS